MSKRLSGGVGSGLVLPIPDETGRTINERDKVMQAKHSHAGFKRKMAIYDYLMANKDTIESQEKTIAEVVQDCSKACQVRATRHIIRDVNEAVGIKWPAPSIIPTKGKIVRQIHNDILGLAIQVSKLAKHASMDIDRNVWDILERGRELDE